MSTRLRVRSVLLAAAFLAAAAAHPGLARAAGVDFWNLGTARAELAAANEQAGALADRDDTIMRRIVIKEDLIDALIAGRAGLADVAARFLELNENEPAYLAVLRSTVRGDSDRERSARNVIDYTAPRVADAAARADLRRRLEAELARMQDADHPGVR